MGNGMYVSVGDSYNLSRTYTYNRLRNHTSWASNGIGVKIENVLKNFWSLVLKFTIPRYTLLFINYETYLVHVINCEWNRFVNFPLHMYLSNRTHLPCIGWVQAGGAPALVCLLHYLLFLSSFVPTHFLS